MAGAAEPKSPTQTQDEDSPSFSEMCKIHSYIRKVFMAVLTAINEDENFSEMTAKSYDDMIRHLTFLTGLHKSLVNHHVRLTEEVSKKCPSLVKTHPDDGSLNAFHGCKIRADVIIDELKDILQNIEKDPSYIEIKSYLRTRLPGLSSVNVSLTEKHLLLMNEVSNNCPSMSSNKLPSSLFLDCLLKNKETKASELFVEENSSLVVDEPFSDKKPLKFQEIEKSHFRLQKQVADLKLKISKFDHKMKAMGEELETSRKSLSIAKDTISCLKVNKIQTLECEILKLEETLTMKEHTWSNDVAKLKGHLEDQSKLLDDVRSDKNRINGELKKLEDERCSRDKLIKELQTRLDRVQAEHDSPSNNAKKLNNSLKEKWMNRGNLSRLLKKSKKKL